MSLSAPSMARFAAKRVQLNTSLRRSFHASRRVDVVKPFVLSDIGEGITECQLIQWFVQPGARVQHFDKLCEVQSDKASVEITSPYEGVIKKLHYAADDMAITGKPLVDIDVIGEEAGEEEGDPVGKEGGAEASTQESEVKSKEDTSVGKAGVVGSERETTEVRDPPREAKGDYRSLATPAVRHLTKELKVDITEIEGTGRDGRVLKEDVHRFASQRTEQSNNAAAPSTTPTRAPAQDETKPLTPVQTQMFKTMTRSLQIPHFLYTCAADMSAITTTRQRLNTHLSKTGGEKLTHLPFILKAVSLALTQHPLLNSALDTASNPAKPTLTQRAAHNIGVAIDTPSGLLVPVLKNVQDMSIAQIATQLRDLSSRARAGKLAPTDFQGATFTVSNIGSVGGGVVSPVISAPQVAILGVGRSKVVPAFDAETGELVRREELVFSWSADHRVVDGAECARCAERVRGLVEDPAGMLVELR